MRPGLRSPTRRHAGIALLCIAGALLLAACGDNQYGPPVEGQPRTWGQQHYIDNQLRQEQIQNQMGR